MKKSKFSEEQIAYLLRHVDTASPVADVCRQMGVSEATLFIWKKKYTHLGVNELCQVQQWSDENGRLARLVADLFLDKHILAEAVRKKAEAHTAPRAGRLGLSERRALTVAHISAAILRYAPRPDPDPSLREPIVALAHRHRRYGAGRIDLKLRQEGRLANHKRRSPLRGGASAGQAP